MNEALRDIRRRVMDRSPGRIHHENKKYAGHEERVADHERRVSAVTCECGSGRPYGDCCMSEDRQTSSPGVHYALPKAIVPGMARRHAVEDAFRLRAFHTFHRAHRDVDDPTLRFGKALVASAKSVAPEDILAWNEEFGRHDVSEEDQQ